MEENRNNDWLLSYKKDITSQCGEDGILEKIFEIIKGDKWCVEFGAYTGKKLSNTWNLLINKNWFGVLIEADKKKFIKLKETYKNINRVICFKKFVNFSGNNSIDNILSETNIPKSFDLISIDIDGNDYHIWDSMEKYTPKVVVIEFNPTIPDDIEFIQEKNMKIWQGSSLLSLINLANKKDYELIAVTLVNAIFVKKKYYNLFKIADNSLSLMHNNAKQYQTRLFQLFDGTLVLIGCDKLLWHNGIYEKKIKQKKIQVLPKFLRVYPPNYHPLYKLWKRIYNKILRTIKLIQEKGKNKMYYIAKKTTKIRQVITAKIILVDE